MSTTADYVRHECGHLIIAKALGFRTGAIVLNVTQAHAELDIIPSCGTLAETEEFIERRVMVLYAGVVAQSLQNKQIVPQVCTDLLKTTALDDWRKIQEYVRLLAGIKHPGCKTADEFAPKLKDVDDYIANKAGEIVDKRKELILSLCNFFFQRRMAALKVRNHPSEKFVVTRDEIDNFLPIRQAFPSPPIPSPK
jgi:hypothetical protein